MAGRDTGEAFHLGEYARTGHAAVHQLIAPGYPQRTFCHAKKLTDVLRGAHTTR